MTSLFGHVSKYHFLIGKKIAGLFLFSVSKLHYSFRFDCYKNSNLFKSSNCKSMRLSLFIADELPVEQGFSLVN